MVDDPDCPCCGARDFDGIGRATYTRRARGPRLPHVELRHRVLFDLWRRGDDAVTIRYLLCRACGFALYAPRPTEAEIAAKYRFLAEHEPAPIAPEAGAIARRRSADLARILDPVRPEGRAARVLDVGGGTGALMHAFVARGDACFLVDYARAAIPGVTRLGDTLDTLDTLPMSSDADVAVCSHVVEHVGDPRALLARIAPHVRPGGALFVEAPIEIRGGAPRQRDPVTHINFFTEGSLACCLALAGWHVARVWSEPALVASGRSALVARALASPGATPAWRLRESARAARALVDGGLRGRVGDVLRRAGLG